MIALIIISLLVLAAAAFTIYRKQQALSDKNPEYDLLPARFGGLFDDRGFDEPALATARDEAKDSRRRAALLERAARCDVEALTDAHASRDASLYAEVLDALVRCQEGLRPLVSRIVESNEMRANPRLAERLMEAWKSAPDKRSTTEMLHIAALADDATMYQKAVETVLRFWRGGQISSFPPEELLALIESEYWVLAPEARRSGAGFTLKRSLVNCRRELAAAMRP